MEFNCEQKEALNIDKNVALSAGAGSGKTRVLTERYLRLLESGIDVAQIVAITFTEKAALEMKNRIREQIVLRVEKGEKTVDWQKALDKLEKANISTIHSFCSNIVKENAAFLGMDFNFKIINDVDSKEFLKDTASQLLNSYFSNEENSEEVLLLNNLFENKYKEEKFIEETLKIRVDILEKGLNFEEIIKNATASMENFILKIIYEINEIYREYKLKRDMLDYTDLQTMAAELLEIKELREAYKKRYKRIMVDEFQDTNDLQKSIIYSLTKDSEEKIIDKRLFIVGDKKQAIYGFRGTDNRVFKEVSEEMGRDAKKSMNICYRSEKEIIYGINGIFKNLINGYEELKPKEEEPGEEKRIMIVRYNEGENKASNTGLKLLKEKLKHKVENTISLSEFEAALEELKDNDYKYTSSKSSDTILKSIKLLRDKGLGFKDITILIRNRNLLGDLEEKLEEYNIPYCIIGGTGFYEKEEVKDVLALYKFAINSRENGNIIEEYSILKSPIFQVPDDVLFRLRINQLKEEKDFIEAIGETVIELKEELADSESNYAAEEDIRKLEAALSTLEKLLDIGKKLSVTEILKGIIKECSIKENVILQKNGMQKFRNIEKLLKVSEEFDKEYLFTPQEFLAHIEKLNNLGVDDSEAALDTENSEAVKIMTIHGSKGLEFKGVIIPAIDKNVISRSISDLKEAHMLIDNNKFLLKYNEDNSESEDFKQAVAIKMEEVIDEEIRILYVAMTRAEKYIVLTGKEEETELTGNKLEDLKSYGKMIDYALSIKAKGNELVEYIQEDTLPQIEAAENYKELESFDRAEIRERIDYTQNVKARRYNSASKYMQYSKDPKLYYMENVLRIKHEDYEQLPDIKKDEKEQKNTLAADVRGTAVHSIIEYINENNEENYEEYLEHICNNIKAENKDIKEELVRYIDNYFSIEAGLDSLGNKIDIQNEAQYLFSPLEDKKMMLWGFIDRVEVFEKDGKYTAVITDYKTNKIRSDESMHELTEHYAPQLLLYGAAVEKLLYVKGRKVDEIVLQLYFLDCGKRVEVQYDRGKVEELMYSMDSMEL